MSLLGRLFLLVTLTWVVVRGQDPFADCPPDDACREDPEAPICSGAGTCVCGQCACVERANPAERISGRFCECDNFTCERFNGQACGGPERGECSCGGCRCRPGWSGRVCECSTSTAACMEPGSDKVCSNKGQCVCGRCRCFQHEDEFYSGQYCDVCPTCPGKCESLRHCVECRAFNAGPLKDDCEARCPERNFQVVEEAEVIDRGERLCSFFLGNDCRYQFVYGGAGPVRVKRWPECPKDSRQVVLKSTDAAKKGGSAGNGAGLGGAAAAAVAALLAAMW